MLSRGEQSGVVIAARVRRVDNHADEITTVSTRYWWITSRIGSEGKRFLPNKQSFDIAGGMGCSIEMLQTAFKLIFMTGSSLQCGIKTIFIGDWTGARDLYTNGLGTELVVHKWWSGNLALKCSFITTTLRAVRSWIQISLWAHMLLSRLRVRA